MIIYYNRMSRKKYKYKHKYKYSPKKKYKPRRKGIRFKDVLLWIGIIMAALIIIGLIFFNAFNNFNNNVEDVPQKIQDVKIENKEYKSILATYPLTNCGDVGISNIRFGVSIREARKNNCEEVCKSNYLVYGYFRCEEEILKCYCKKKSEEHKIFYNEKSCLELSLEAGGNYLHDIFKDSFCIDICNKEGLSYINFECEKNTDNRIMCHCIK